LKSSDRAAVVPGWPLADPIPRELAMWEREWTRPVSLLWQWNGLEDEVALYVRNFLEAAAGSASTAARTLVRQQREALGLSLDGLTRLRVRIVDADVDKKKAGASSRVSDSAAAAGLTVIPGGRAAA
jgi:hypothetical protein